VSSGLKANETAIHKSIHLRGGVSLEKRRLDGRSMRKFFRKLCCCLRPQPSKKVDSDGSNVGLPAPQNRENERRRKPIPNVPTTPPNSIITQVSKDGPHVNISGVQTALKNASLRHSGRRSLNQSQNNQNENNKNPQDRSLINSLYPNQYPNKQDWTVVKENSKNTVGTILPPKHPSDHHKKCLIIDLDETLVHSSFKPVKNADFVIPVEIENVVHMVHVLKRPYADEFLKRCGELFECVLFTASLDMYADPVADLLDKKTVFRHRLFRDSCVFHEGNYVKDLGLLGRDLDKILIVDNSPISYAFHPENAVAVRTWFDDPTDRELLELIPLLEKLAECSDIYEVLCKNYMGNQAKAKELYG